MPYLPKQGDIVYLNCDPQAGHEQAGRRPAVVVSNRSFHLRVGGFAIVCPITNTHRPFPLHIPLDSRTKTTGVVLCEQMKSFDLRARNVEFRETLPDDLLQEILERVMLSIEPD
jgi:mRNA interferase MazF